MTTALAAAALLFACAFGASTYERWLVRRSPQLAAWTIALVMFALGAGALAWGSAWGWTGGSFRVFFAFGAVLNVPFLALGQLYVQVRNRRLVDRIATGLRVVAGFACGVVLVSPLRGPIPADTLPQGSEVFGPWPRALAAGGSGLGATIVFAGAVIGVWRLWRAQRRRAGGLAMIALGTAILSASGLLNSALGQMRAFSVTLTIGIAVLFAGFLVSS